MSADTDFLDPTVIAAVSGLELRARRVVEGFLAGRHRSPLQGFAIEFAQHRPYSPGDELRRIDWKVYARSDRLHLKQYQVETDMPVWLLIDASASMAYSSPGVPHGWRKYDYAATAAASLAHLALRQRDAVGLVVFDAAPRAVIRPVGHPGHMATLISELAAAAPCQTPRTSLADVLDQLADRLGPRGLVILISDLLDDPHAVLTGLRRLHRRGHDLIALHTLDPWERTFPFHGPVIFENLETDTPGSPLSTVRPPANSASSPTALTAETTNLRDGYLAELAAFSETLSTACLALRYDFVPLDTSRSLAEPLAAYLASRGGSRHRSSSLMAR